MSAIANEAPTPMAVESISTDAGVTAPKAKGQRKNGKNWHETKKAFRPTAGLTPYEERKERDAQRKAVKVREQEMKDEKEAERNRRVQVIKDRRKAKEEKERYERMAEKMHQKRVERRKKREKRNKLLNS